MTEEQMYLRLYVVARQMEALVNHMEKVIFPWNENETLYRLTKTEAEALIAECRVELKKRGVPLEANE